MLGRWTAAALMALAWSGDARAAAPESDPLAPPAIAVSPGSWAYEGRHPADGDTFTASPGGWSGIGNSYSYQWQRCTGAATGCTDIAGATSTTLVADTLFGSHLRVAVTATNADGSATAYAAAGPLADELPHLRPGPEPAIAGVLEEGETLTLDVEPHYAGSRPITSTVSWERCSGPLDNHPCDPLAHPGGRNGSYALTAADVDRYLRARFWVYNGAGHWRMSATPRVGPVHANTSPPAATVDPSVSGAAVDAGVLQGAIGTWSGARPMTHALQWLRCDDAGCAEIAGATISQYRAGTADLGHRLRLRVTARNAYGEQVATSAPTAPVAAAPPAPGKAPSVSGTALDGQVLAGERGTFTGTAPVTETVAWERCDAAGGECVTIPGAEADSYALVPADIGRRLRFKVTATNAAGTASARSAATEVVRAIPPAATALPEVTGEARDEQVLEGSPGTWSGSPEIAFAHQWMRCGDAGCAPVAGATDARYELRAEDVGSRLRLRVTASNFDNSVDALSEPTAVVAASAPRAVEAPAVAGDARDGVVLTAAAGTWKGTGPLAHGYRWERCADGAGGCSAIAGAGSSTYRLASADVGRRVRVVVVAEGPGGTAEAVSAPTHPVAAVAPAVTAAPELAGAARDGETLRATAAGWSGTQPVETAVRWERCDPECATVGSGASYVVAAADVGSRLRVVERATNAGGAAEAASEPTAVIAARPPLASAAPSISGAARDGETLTVDRGTWEGTPELAFARQWLRCSSSGELGGCETIPAAQSPSLQLSADDVGGFLRVRVTATNGAGAASALSQAVGPVTAAPPAALPAEGPFLRIDGDADQSAPDVGDRVVVEPGRWAGTGRGVSFAYRWERCGTSGCREVPGRTGAAETVTPEDAGTQLRVVVTATNDGGSAAQATPRLGVTRGPAAGAPAPSAAPEGTPAPAAPAPPAALPAGSLLAPEACQVVARGSVAAAGVTLRVPAGTASSAQPLLATLTVRGRPERISLRAGARPVRLAKARRGRLVAALRPAVLARAQLLQLAVTPRLGRPAKASVRLVTRPCHALLSVRLRGRRLTLRADQRTPIGRVAFALPKGLAIKPGSARTATLPFAGGEAARGLDLRLARRTLTLSGLPPRTAAATLSVDLAGTPRRGRALRFSATTDTARMAATASVRR